MKNSNLISLVIPTYNRAEFLKSLLEDLLLQNIDDFEFIVIDDGSIDNTQSVVNNFCGKVAYHKKSNGGPSSARNVGIHLAAGKYIKFVDSDDSCDLAAIRAVHQCMQTMSTKQIALGDVVCVNANHEPVKSTYGLPLAAPYEVVKRIAFFERDTPSCLGLFPKQALVDVGLFDENLWLGEDSELAFRLLSQGYEFIRIPKVVSFAMQHNGDRLTNNVDFSYIQRYRKLIEKIINSTFPSIQPTNEEISAYSKRIWIRARELARLGSNDDARYFFDLAFNLAGNNAYVGNKITKIMYEFFHPTDVEKYLSRMKKLYLSS